MKQSMYDLNFILSYLVSLLLKSTEVSTAVVNPKKVLLITADAKAAHQSVVTVMDIAGQLGFLSLHITTKEYQDQ